MNEKYTNKIRKVLNEKGVALGANICTREAVFAEALGHIYDYLWIDWEHSWMSRSDIMNHLIAAKAAGAATVVRIPWNDAVLAKPILDMGPEGLVFPMINTVEEAKAAVEAVTYPPNGVRGWGPMRCRDYGKVGDMQYIEESRERVYMIIQCESKTSVDNLKEILKVDGIDAVCIGRSDLSGSLGKLTQFDDPEVIEYCKRAVEITLEAGKQPMVNCGFNEDDLNRWRSWGATLFTISSDIDMALTEARKENKFLRGLK